MRYDCILVTILWHPTDNNHPRQISNSYHFILWLIAQQELIISIVFFESLLSRIAQGTASKLFAVRCEFNLQALCDLHKSDDSIPELASLTDPILLLPNDTF